MTDAASLVYAPLNEYKPWGPDIGIVDGPLEYLTTAGVTLPLPFSTRMTVVRLENGDLFLHSPIMFEATLARKLQSMGRIRHLVSPNQFPHRRVVAGVSRCHNVGVSRCASARTGAGDWRGVLERSWGAGAGGMAG